MNPIPSFANEWMAAALGLLACLPLLMRRSWQPLHFPIITLVPIGLLAVVGLQVATGLANYWQQHMLVALYLGWATMMMMLGSALRQQAGIERLVPVIAWTLLAAGSISVGIVALQVAGVEVVWIVPHGSGGYSANLGQPNQLADLLGLSLASLLYLLATRRIGTISAVMLALGLLAALSLTGSRTGWLFVLALVALTAMARFSKQKMPTDLLLSVSLAMVAAFAALQFVLPILLGGGAPLMPTDKIVVAAAGPSIRLQLLEVAWRAFLSSPWVGIGVGQFAWHDFLLADSVTHNAGLAAHAHNLFAQLLAETGLAGLAIVLLGLGLWLSNVLRGPISPERALLIALLAILFIHSMLEYPLWYGYFLGIAALLLGIGDEKTAACRMDLGPIVGVALLAFGALSLTSLVAHERKLEYWFAMGKVGRLSSAQLDTFARDMADVRQKSLLAPYADDATAIMLQLNRQDLDAKLAVSRQAIRHVPTASLVYKHAALLALDGQRTEALSQLHLALSRHPGMAKEFHRHLFKLILKGEIRILPLLMLVQERSFSIPKLKRDSSGKTPDLIRDKAP